MKQVTVLAPAKLNLTLDVTGLLPGGYHALDMIMQAITLHERVSLRKSRDLILRLPGCRVMTNEELGLDGNAKEAVAFAVLANEFCHGVPNNAPRATGAARPVVMGKLTLA